MGKRADIRTPRLGRELRPTFEAANEKAQAERRKRTTTMLAKGCARTGAGALMEHRFARGTPLSRGGATGAAALRSRKSVQVHAGKAAKKMGGMNRRYRQSGMMQQQRYQEPPIDPDNEEFVLFARSKEDPFPTWYPVTILQGGSQANLLVRARENEITKMLTGNTLAKSLGVTLYKEREKVEDMARKNQPFLKKAKTMEFAFKVREKDVPKSWMKADKTLEIIPPEEDCKGILDKLQDTEDLDFEKGMEIIADTFKPFNEWIDEVYAKLKEWAKQYE